MTKVSELVSQNVGNQIINSNTWGGILYNVKAFGSKADGITNDAISIQSAITAATTNGGIIFCPPGTYKISTALTFPSNVTLWFANGAKLSIDTGVTVTINGCIQAGLYQIFSGLGTVVGNAQLDYIYPQWFGATIGLSAPDSGAAINSAINFASQMNYDPIVKIPAGNYNIYTPIVLLHGYEYNNITIDGYGATLQALTNNMVIITIKAYGTPASFQNIGKTHIAGLKIKGNSKASIGIMIGKNGAGSPYGVSGFFPSTIRDVDIMDCTINCKIAESRMFQFLNCGFTTTVIGGNCLYLESISGGFCGDLWIADCQFQVESTNTSSICIKGVVTGSGTNSDMNGIHFNDVVMYGKAIDVTGTNATGNFRDWFIDNCVIDGPSLSAGFTGYSFSGFAGGRSGVILIDNGWINSCNAGINFFNVDNCIVRGTKISSISLQAITFSATFDCSAVDCKMYDCNTAGNGGGVINLSGVGKRNKVRGCNLSNTAYANQFITAASTQIRPVMTDNTSDHATQAVVTNFVTGTAGTDFYLAGNLNGN